MIRYLPIRCRHCPGEWNDDRLLVGHKLSCHRPGASPRPVQSPAWPMIVDLVARTQPSRESYLAFHPMHASTSARTNIGGGR